MMGNKKKHNNIIFKLVVESVEHSEKTFIISPPSLEPSIVVWIVKKCN